jgi:hypothetical protein
LVANLSIQEVGDALVGVAGAGSVAALNITEASDAVTGLAFGNAKASLTATEAADVVTGTGAVVSGVSGNLVGTEANDALSATGKVLGTVGSAIVLEANDNLFGTAINLVPGGGVLHITEDDDWVISSTLLSLNQWVRIPPPSGVWTEVDPNG